MSTFYKDVITQALTTANAIGMTLNRSSKPQSHDPFQGFDYRELLDLVGEAELSALRKEHNEKAMKEIEANFKDGDKFKMGSPVISKRGKTKGLNGWVVNEMPSQYNENETAYLVNDLQGKGGWVNGKSLIFRVPQIGEEDVFKSLVSKREKWSNEVKRSSRVRCTESNSVGLLLGFGKIGFCVAVQWEGMQAEEWVSVGRLEVIP